MASAYGRLVLMVSASGRRGGIEVTTQAAYNLIQRMCDAGIIVETTGRSYDRIFVAPRVLEVARA